MATGDFTTVLGANSSVGENAYYSTSIGYNAHNNEPGTTLIANTDWFTNNQTRVYFVAQNSTLSQAKLGAKAGLYITNSSTGEEYAIPYESLVNDGGDSGGDSGDSSSQEAIDYGEIYKYSLTFSDVTSVYDLPNGEDAWNTYLNAKKEWLYALPKMETIGSGPQSNWKGVSFQSFLPLATNFNYFFYDCKSIETFSCALPAVSNASYAFYGCTNLKYFKGDLRNLWFVDCMFGTDSSNCTQFDLEAVENILDAMNTSGVNGTLYIGVSNTLNGSQELDDLRDRFWNEKNTQVEFIYSDNG